MIKDAHLEDRHDGIEEDTVDHLFIDLAAVVESFKGDAKAQVIDPGIYGLERIVQSEHRVWSDIADETPGSQFRENIACCCRRTCH